MNPLDTNLSLRGKLILTSAISSALALVLAGTAIVIHDNRDYAERQRNELTTQAAIVADTVAAPLLFDDRDAAQSYLDVLKANDSIILGGVYDAAGQLFARFARSGQADARIADVLEESVRPGFMHGELVVQSGIDENGREVGTVVLVSQVESVASRSLRYGGIILLVMAGSLLISVPLSIRMNRAVAQRIGRIGGAAREVALGNLAVDLAAHDGRDEVGQLTTDFRQMLDGLRSIARQVGESAQTLTDSAGEILAATQDISNSTSGTAATVAETLTTVEVVRKAARDSSAAARRVADAAKHTSEVSQTGSASAVESQEAMRAVQAQMNAIGERLIKLGDQVEQISEITIGVEYVSDQSKLLAINASIEAAKAGTYGVGFQVVADEIKTLAARSKLATDKVQKILMDIQRAMNEVLDASQLASDAVTLGVNRTGSTGDAMRDLERSAFESANAASRIADSAERQLAEVDDLAISMEQIHEASEQNANGSRQIAASARGLGKLSERLRTVVELYRL